MAIFDILLERNKKVTWPYMSSIMFRRQHLQFFEEHFGKIDYDWLLRMTEGKRAKEIEPCVIRYINGNNLSLNEEYRRIDYYYSLLTLDKYSKPKKVKKAIQRMNGTRARYYYVIGNMEKARYYFRKSSLNIKTILYVVTSFYGNKFVKRHFRVFG